MKKHERRKIKKKQGCPTGQPNRDDKNKSDVSLLKDFAEKSPKNSLEHGQKSQVKTKSSKNRAIFGLRYRLSKDALKILKLLGQDMTQVEVSETTSFAKQKVNYWALKFLRNGLLKIKCDGKPKFYEWTALSLKILTRSENGVLQPCLMEDFPLKFRLVKDGSNFSWEKLGEPKNWVKLGIHVGNVRVVKTSGNIIIHTGQIAAVDPDHALVEAGSIIGAVKAVLESHGVVLDPVGLPLRKPIYKFYTPEAEFLNRLFGTVTTEEGSLDNSPPDKIPHAEWIREAAKNYLRMPNRVKEISDKLNRIEHTQEILSQEQKEIKHNQKGSSENMLTFAQGMRDHLKLVHALTDVAEALKKESDVRREFYELETKHQDSAVTNPQPRGYSLLRRIGSWLNKEVF